jgi:DNA-binding NtrC family response regulator
MPVSSDGNDQRARAYVIDDDVHTLRLLAELIASRGLEPIGFTRISSAKRALRDSVPAVMVVDDDLPDGQGAQLVAEVQSDPRMRDVRVLLCTGAEPSRRREISRLARVLPKPFRLHEVERALAEVVSG